MNLLINKDLFQRNQDRQRILTIVTPTVVRDQLIIKMTAAIPTTIGIFAIYYFVFGCAPMTIIHPIHVYGDMNVGKIFLGIALHSIVMVLIVLESIVGDVLIKKKGLNGKTTPTLFCHIPANLYPHDPVCITNKMVFEHIAF